MMKRFDLAPPSTDDAASTLAIDVIVDESVAQSLNTALSERRLRCWIVAVMTAAARWGGCDSGELVARITDDATIHQINRVFLQHDFPTDVISFPYECNPPRVGGELVVSWDTASASAAEHGDSAVEELLLYVAHGTLHLVGLGDSDDRSKEIMRGAEAAVLLRVGLNMPSWEERNTTV